MKRTLLDWLEIASFGLVALAYLVAVVAVIYYEVLR